MTWDLQTAKDRLGIADGSQDAEIQRLMDVTLTTLETLLQRELMAQVGIVEDVLDVCGRSILLKQYPVIQVTELIDPKSVAALPAYYLRKETGAILFDSPVVVDRLQATYDAGYSTLPADLEEAMWQAFEWLWGAAGPDAGTPDAGTAPGLGTGGVSRVTIQDFGSVTLDTAAVGGSGPGAELQIRGQLDWGWLYPWSSTFQMYRSERGVGMGIV